MIFQILKKKKIKNIKNNLKKIPLSILYIFQYMKILKKKNNSNSIYIYNNYFKNIFLINNFNYNNINKFGQFIY